MIGGLIFGVANPVLVVDGSAIDQRSRAVNHKRLGRCFRTECANDRFILVADIRTLITLRFYRRFNFVLLLRQRWIDEQKLHVLVGILLFQSSKRRREFETKRTSGSGQNHDRRFFITVLAELMRFSIKRFKFEIRDHFADSHVARLDLDGCLLDVALLLGKCQRSRKENDENKRKIFGHLSPCRLSQNVCG